MFLRWTGVGFDVTRIAPMHTKRRTMKWMRRMLVVAVRIRKLAEDWH